MSSSPSRRWWVPAVCGLVAGAVLVSVLHTIFVPAGSFTGGR